MSLIFKYLRVSPGRAERALVIQPPRFTIYKIYMVKRNKYERRRRYQKYNPGLAKEKLKLFNENKVKFMEHINDLSAAWDK